MPTSLSVRSGTSGATPQLGFEYKRMEVEDDCYIAVVEASCRYKSPARYDDQILLQTRILAMRRSVIKFGYRVLRADGQAPEVPGMLLAEGETTHVVVNRSMQKVPLHKSTSASSRASLQLRS